MKYVPTIGLEIHAELSTLSKMFCACRNDPDEERANANICPVCMAHPGALPVINREAVHKVLLMGVAVGGTLADRTVFDRKNYFYPDIPKGYQISQYEFPLVSGGELAGVKITRVHLEEDTARSQHPSAGSGEAQISLVDFNRAGVPLMELVTEPVIHSGEGAGNFARQLQLLLRYLGAGEANMEKGQMRVEANISIAPEGAPALGTKVEVKNLNSFRSVERAIAYEIERQSGVLEAGGQVEHETRGWDENRQETFTQRRKEKAHDYRYFPEPDLPELRLSEMPEFSRATLVRELPELPEKRTARYVGLGLKPGDAGMFVRDARLGNFFDAVVVRNPDLALLAANYLGSDIAGMMEKRMMDASWLTNENAARFGALMLLAQQGALSSRGTKDTLALMIDSNDDPQSLASAHGLMQQSDEGALMDIARKVIADNPNVADDYRAGKAPALQFLVGQGMKATKGSGNPEKLREVFEKILRM